MKKIMSLIKAGMSDNMELFRYKKKDNNSRINRFLPVVIYLLIFFVMWGYANMFMEPLVELHQEYAVLTLFVAATTILTIVEGIYKAGNLLFNCKDDDMLFSLPIRKSTVLFLRLFKFYVFEVLYNSLFMLPAIIVYATKVQVDFTYIISAICALVFLPIFPIIISGIIGMIISALSSLFKKANIAQIIITMLVLLVVFYASFNMQNMIDGYAKNAKAINDVVSSVYYPAGAYIKLVTNFNVIDLLVFLGIHLGAALLIILLLSKVYFKINSRVKVVKIGKTSGKYKIKSQKPIKALIKKELNRFINSPVFVTNAAFGLVLFLAGCILASVRLDGIVAATAEWENPLTMEKVKSFAPAILFAFITFSSLMSSITSSMISLEGRAFNMLKSLPVNPFTIIKSKIMTAVLIMLPFIFIGDIIVFIAFNFSIIDISLLLIASVILPIVAETFGILIDLKYCNMSAENDTEAVKQSRSAMIATLSGVIISMAVFIAVMVLTSIGVYSTFILLIGTTIFSLICVALLLYLKKASVKEFNRITV